MLCAAERMWVPRSSRWSPTERRRRGRGAECECGRSGVCSEMLLDEEAREWWERVLLEEEVRLCGKRERAGLSCERDRGVALGPFRLSVGNDVSSSEGVRSVKARRTRWPVWGRMRVAWRSWTSEGGRLVFWGL